MLRLKPLPALHEASGVSGASPTSAEASAEANPPAAELRFWRPRQLRPIRVLQPSRQQKPTRRRRWRLRRRPNRRLLRTPSRSQSAADAQQPAAEERAPPDFISPHYCRHRYHYFHRLAQAPREGRERGRGSGCRSQKGQGVVAFSVTGSRGRSSAESGGGHR